MRHIDILKSLACVSVVAFVFAFPESRMGDVVSEIVIYDEIATVVDPPRRRRPPHRENRRF
jgi:hypothetical protein